MEVSIGSRIKHAWNAFLNRDPTGFYRDIGVGYSYRPDRPRLTRGNERSIVTSVYNRIALDCASISIQHVRLDDSERFLEKIPSGLNDCLNLSANIDQTGRAFLQDVVLSMLDEGCVAIIPVDTDDDPDTTGSYKIESMRTGKILEWFPSHIKARVYNERTGLKEDIVVPKDTVAIIENPLYAVINEPNSTMQRLIRKLNLLDVVDEQSSSGKLDLIIQLPYVIKTEARRQQAEKRRVEIERQLAGSKYGIAYTDGTERITQLNRSVENNLMKQIEYLTSMLYSQLGTPHMLNVMLLARDMNGRRIYASKAELASAFNVGEILTAEQFEGKTRKTDDSKTKKLLAIITNLNDYSLGATKGGEVTHFTQFDIDFNQEKSLLETRCSGALTRVYHSRNFCIYCSMGELSAFRR